MSTDLEKELDDLENEENENVKKVDQVAKLKAQVAKLENKINRNKNTFSDEEPFNIVHHKAERHWFQNNRVFHIRTKKMLFDATPKKAKKESKPSD